MTIPTTLMMTPLLKILMLLMTPADDNLKKKNVMPVTYKRKQILIRKQVVHIELFHEKAECVLQLHIGSNVGTVCKYIIRL